MTNTLQESLSLKESLLRTGKTSSERQSNTVANVVKSTADFWAQYGFLPIFLTAMLLGVSNAAEAEERSEAIIPIAWTMTLAPQVHKAAAQLFPINTNADFKFDDFLTQVLATLTVGGMLNASICGLIDEGFSIEAVSTSVAAVCFLPHIVKSLVEEKFPSHRSFIGKAESLGLIGAGTAVLFPAAVEISQNPINWMSGLNLSLGSFVGLWGISKGSSAILASTDENKNATPVVSSV